MLGSPLSMPLVPQTHFAMVRGHPLLCSGGGTTASKMNLLFLGFLRVFTAGLKEKCITLTS